MTKLHTHHVQGVLHKGTKPQPATTSGGFHGGTNLKKGHVHEGVALRQYGLHGGTDLRMGVLKRK
jgi:hypothetical protein